MEEIIVTSNLEKNISANFSFVEPLVFDYRKNLNNYPQLLNFVIEQKQLEAERLIQEAEEKKKKAEEEIKKLKNMQNKGEVNPSPKKSPPKRAFSYCMFFSN